MRIMIIDELEKAIELIETNDNAEGNSDAIDEARICISSALQEMRHISADHVGTYFEQVFGVGTVEKYSDLSAEDYDEYGMTTYCGMVCYDIINQAKKLLNMCDSHEDVVDNILKGTIAACSIVCFG